MTAGDASADNTASGFVTGERIVLTTTPTGTDYSWGQSSPNASALTRSALSSLTAASPTFTPDVAGTYVLTVNVDGDDYVLRLTVQSAAIAEPVEASRYSPRSDAQIPDPAAGASLYYSSDREALVFKDAAGNIAALPRVIVDDEFSILNSGATEVGSFEAEEDTIYVVRGEVYGDDGSDPTFLTLVRHIGNGQGGTFTEITADGALNWSISAGAGGPGTVPINVQVSGPDSPRKTRVRFWIETQFAYVDV